PGCGEARQIGSLTMNVEEWVQEHGRRGHHPYPSPTADNPERWLCECPDAAGTAVWRILTPRQVEQKFAHLGVALRGANSSDGESTG
ncbi:hypothetical protein ABQE58_26310, partial [Mycolicibacterium elephantis]